MKFFLMYSMFLLTWTYLPLLLSFCYFVKFETCLHFYFNTQVAVIKINIDCCIFVFIIVCLHLVSPVYNNANDNNNDNIITILGNCYY